MIAILKSRCCFLFTVVLLGLTACNQGETVNSDLLEAEAYLGVAELYRDQGQFRASMLEAQNALEAMPTHDKTTRFIARLYLDLGSPSAAADILERVLEANPDDIEARLLLIQSRLFNGEQAQALIELENLQSEDPDQETQRLWLQGLAFAQSNSTLLAHETFRSVLEIDPDHLPSLINLSMLEYQSGNEFAAQEFIDQATEVDPNDLDLLIWRGQYMLLQEEYAQSEQAFFDALEILGTFDTMTQKRMAVLQAILVPLQMQNKNDEALRYSQIIAETPQGQLQNSLVSAVSFFQEGDFEQSESALNTVLAAAPDHPGSNILMGMMRFSQGDFQAAQLSLERFAQNQAATPNVITTLANTHLRLNQPDRALSVLLDAVDRYPEDGSLLAMMGLTQQLLGDIETSIETFNSAIELLGDSPELHYSLANSYLQNSQPDIAVEQYQQALRLDPDHLQAKAALLGFYIRNDRVADARATVADWIARDPSSIDNTNFAGQVEFIRENYNEAAEFFNQSLELDPDNVAARMNLARISINQQDLDEAESRLNEVLEISPGSIEAHSGMLALGELSGSMDSYVARVNQVSEDNPEEFAPAMVLASYYVATNNLDRAREQADIAYTRQVNTMTENTLVQVILRQVDVARASDRLNPARELVAYSLQIQPNNIETLIRAAGIEVQADDFAAASSYIEQIERLEPENSILGLQLRGDLAIEEGDFEQALAAFRQSWEIAPNAIVGTKMHAAMVNLQNQPDAASDFLDEWESLLPDDSTMHLLKGMHHQEQGEDSDAIARYEIAYEQLPDNIVLLNNLGWLYQEENPERALQLATRAAELAPENADVLDTYGWILLKQNQQDHAIQVLERAAELAPNSAAIQEHLEAARQ